MSRCEECKHAIWDYEEYYGTTQKQWFVERCKKDLDMEVIRPTDFGASLYTNDLDTITIKDKTSSDVLQLFKEEQ